MTAQEIEEFDRARRCMYLSLCALGDIIEAEGRESEPVPWIPTRKLVPAGPNLDLARLSDDPPERPSPG